MSLAPGTRLGPYEIVAPIGAGGMGEVYRARDTRLDRSVAVKILPVEFAQNAQLRLRFEREAKTISQLSHPNICALYDVGDNYLVMELLEGETLADRLLRGPVPLAEALRIAGQIADALAKAHRQSIIHRDLKPGNIMLTRSGAKLLDFGLARVGGVLSGPADATHQKPLTAEGTIVGTFNYMAPEQLEGAEADERTDIFAFGSVLYEMVSGKRAFSGSTRTSLIAAIVSRDPTPLSQVQPIAPASVERLVARCLAKDPDARWQCAADLRWELRRIEEEVAHPAAEARPRRSNLAAFVTAAVAAFVATFFAVEYARRPRPEPPLRFTVAPPNGWIFAVGYIGPPAMAPDGRKFAVVGTDLTSGKNMLLIRDLTEAEPKLLAGTEGAAFPFWSPDSTAIGFFAGGKLKRVDLSGGATQTLCDASLARGATWSSNGDIIFCPSPLAPLYAIPASGGTPRRLTTLDPKLKESSHRWPWILPDGRHFLFSIRRPGVDLQSGAALYVGSIDSEEKKLLLKTSSNAAYVEPGYVLYVRDRTLYARRFNTRTLSFTAPERPAAHAIQFHGSGFALFSAAPRVLVYQTGTVLSALTVIGRDGRVQATLGDAAECFGPNLSVDGHHVVYSLLDPVTGNSDVWLYDMERRVARRQTFHPADDFYGVLSPDQTELYFASNRSGIPSIYAKPLDGSDERIVLESNIVTFPQSISSDGRFLLFRQLTTAQSDIWALPLPAGKPFPFATSPFNEIQPVFSRSGRFVAYASNESGRYEVYVSRFPSGSGRVQISPDGGSQPTWRADEKELYYIGPQERLFAVSIEAGTSLKAGIPTPITTLDVKPSRDDERQYDAAADGKSFIVNSLSGPSRSLPMTVVENWQPDRQ